MKYRERQAMWLAAAVLLSIGAAVSVVAQSRSAPTEASGDGSPSSNGVAKETTPAGQEIARTRRVFTPVTETKYREERLPDGTVRRVPVTTTRWVEETVELREGDEQGVTMVRPATLTPAVDQSDPSAVAAAVEEQKLNKIVQKYHRIRAGKEDGDADQLREEIDAHLQLMLRKQHERWARKITDLEKQLEELRDLKKEREGRSDEIVERRMAELLDEPHVLDWEPLKTEHPGGVKWSDFGPAVSGPYSVRTYPAVPAPSIATVAPGVKPNVGPRLPVDVTVVDEYGSPPSVRYYPAPQVSSTPSAETEFSSTPNVSHGFISLFTDLQDLAGNVNRAYFHLRKLTRESALAEETDEMKDQLREAEVELRIREQAFEALKKRYEVGLKDAKLRLERLEAAHHIAKKLFLTGALESMEMLQKQGEVEAAKSDVAQFEQLLELHAQLLKEINAAKDVGAAKEVEVGDTL